MSIRRRIGAIVYDVPRFERHMRGDWVRIHNRDETIVYDGRGARCEWEFTSDLHIANVFPALGARLMRRVFREWPIVLADAPPPTDAPRVSFVIGHRGRARLPHLLSTLRAIAGQQDVGVECVVIEQSVEREIEHELPPWVRYIHTPVAEGFDYCRSATLNAGAAAARGDVLVLHDNDMLIPARYAAEAAARVDEGWKFVDLKRFTFYLWEPDTHAFFESQIVPTDVSATIVQNLQGASIIVERNAYDAIGGFDEEFVGWGGEDNDFWDRALAHGGVFAFAYLPLIHLWHAPQKGKLQGVDAPARKRYFELREIPPEERIRRLRALRGN